MIGGYQRLVAVSTLFGSVRRIPRNPVSAPGAAAHGAIHSHY